MAKFMRSILGRNKRPQLTAGDMETAKAHGITSPRSARKNIESIRQVQQGQQGNWTGVYGNDVSSFSDPFSPMNNRTAETEAAGQKLASLGKPAKAAKRNGPRFMPSAKGMFGVYD